jgi:two-component system sensor histidine kinase UhpB
MGAVLVSAAGSPSASWRRLARLARPWLASRAAERTRLPLYWRVLLTNAVIIVVATLFLVLTPATVSFPIKPEQALILAVGIVAAVTANAIVLRFSFAPLARLVGTMRTIDLLQPPPRLQATGSIEVSAVIETFNEMLGRLETERRQSTRHVLTALEGERRRIGQELHDDFGQRLTGMLLQLQNILSDAPAEVRGDLLALQGEAQSMLDDIGELAWQLRPGILDDLGLVRALEALVESTAGRAPVRVRASLPASLPAMPPETELAVYRIAQEALTNAIRHAGAHEIDLTLHSTVAGLSLRIADDGRGFAGDEIDGAGIRGMRERALLVDGRLTIESTPHAGATIALDLSLSGSGD